MQHAAHIQSAIELIEHVQETWKANRQMPVDAMLGQYFKARRYIGSKDRGAISELVYFVLRNGGALEWHIEHCDRTASARRVVLAALLLGQQLRSDQVIDLFNGAKYAPKPLDTNDLSIVHRLEGRPLYDARMPLAARLNYPDWMEGRLKDAFGDQLQAAMEALNEAATIDLRANLLKCKDRGDLILALDKDGYFATPTPISPIGVRLKKRLPAFNTQAFKDGLYEMQDEGSQVVAQLVQAKAGQKVIDFCAGAGGKTLAIAATMKNKGRILAWDTAEKRLEQIHKRLARAGVSNVMTHVLRDERDPFTKRHVNSADWVVVDAPCTGSGTWRRNPDLKWRTTLEDLQELKTLQQRILDSAARLVKQGGRLVYITCSIFPDENFWQVKQFLTHNPTFRVEAPDKMWNNHLQMRDNIGPCLHLSPHQDGTDGFFAAVLINDASGPRS